MNMTMRDFQPTREDMALLQGVIEAAPQYWERSCGSPPGPADAHSTYSILPEGIDYDRKFVFGFFLGDRAIAYADLIRGYPRREAAYLGALVVAEVHQRRGHGRSAWKLLEQRIATWPEIEVVVAAPLRAHDVLGFFEKMGFCATGETKPYATRLVQSEYVFMERRL
jgi:GNAT superfamily N-acetyltransferase